MKRRIFIFDTERCFGCNGCVAACANANGTPAGILWRTVHKLPPEDGDNRTRYLSMACNHCDNPPCANGCPTGALQKRQEDGVVTHNADICIGCRYCEMSCPYDAIKFIEERGVISKCQFCYERLDEGQTTACVETCFSGALMQVVVESEEELKALSETIEGFDENRKVDPSIRFVNDQTRAELRKDFPPAVPPVDPEKEIK